MEPHALPSSSAGAPVLAPVSVPVAAPAGAEGPSVLRIDCAECAHRHTDHCEDCLVTFLCERESDGAVIIPLEEVRAVRLLQGAGLAPRVRHVRRA